ncbi:MAG TPA: protein kinase [Gemmatimonadales bacterium]|nr:protein kinase [Gemmatimonadales bacterium]
MTASHEPARPVDRIAAALADRYRIERELGQGGMATVYLAHDLKHDRAVAIKILRGDVSALLGAERFLAEIRTTARLRHPNILPLFDSGRVDGTSDLLYYVMPFVEGESLRDRLDREKQLPIPDALRITHEVASALEYAHRQGVVHRDIKPENILLEGGHALLADFGIAKATAPDANLRLTETGSRIGTPLYMSPEQSAGESDLDGRSDLYSLASVLYEMLAGRPPFIGATAEAVLVQRFTQVPPRVTEQRPEVPAPVDAAIRRALARDPEERPQSIERFAALLEAPPAQATEARSIAVLPFENMSADPENAYFGDGIAEEVINALTRVQGLRVAARTSAFSFRGKREDLRVIGDKLNVATVLEGSVRKSGNRLRITAQLISVHDGYHLWSERYDRELTDIFVIQDEIAAAIAGKLQLTFAPPTVEAVKATSAEVQAYELIVRGRALSNQRGRAILTAIACFEQAVALAPNSSAAHTGLGQAYRVKAQYGLGSTAECLPRAITSLRRALELDPGNAEAIGHYGTLSATVDADSTSAIGYWERALAMDPRLSEIRALYAGWGLAIMGEGREDARALSEIRRALSDDPLNPICSTISTIMLSTLGRLDEAVTEARRGIALDPTAFAPRYALVWALTWSRRGSEALAAAEEVMETFGRHPWLLHVLPGIYRQLGDERRAQATYDELMARAVTAPVTHWSRSVAACYMGKLDEALEHALTSARNRDSIGPIWFRWPDIERLQAHPRYGEVLAALSSRPVIEGLEDPATYDALWGRT